MHKNGHLARDIHYFLTTQFMRSALTYLKRNIECYEILMSICTWNS